ncbi:nuclease-related domain-containing protein [Anaerobacillus sp. MEB173]|uniref:nuclease-related domain-containing protein n=1 Tax=Anaerobacillus sp. MEB173 TaxID=3383345 RepID=UPI003F938D8A
MAHLIKLDDYVSRYQFDIYRYPSQYTRLKKERWERLKGEWENAHQLPKVEKAIIGDQVDWSEQKEGFFKRTLNKLKKISKKNRLEDSANDVESYRFKFKSMEEVKKVFLEELFEFQLKWASSSVVEISHIDPRYYVDEQLKFFAQRIPDNYFLLYCPVFKVKNAPVELDIIIVGPTEIWCITILEGSEHSIFQGSSDRFWLEFVGEEQKRLLSPLVAVNRMSSIIQPIIKAAELEIPIKRAVVSPQCLIDCQTQGLAVQFIDKRNFQEWVEKLVKNPTPIKHVQLKAAQLLLSHCQTTGYRRSEFSDEKHVSE